MCGVWGLHLAQAQASPPPKVGHELTLVRDSWDRIFCRVVGSFLSDGSRSQKSFFPPNIEQNFQKPTPLTFDVCLGFPQLRIFFFFLNIQIKTYRPIKKYSLMGDTF